MHTLILAGGTGGPISPEYKTNVALVALIVILGLAAVAAIAFVHVFFCNWQLTGLAVFAVLILMALTIDSNLPLRELTRTGVANRAQTACNYAAAGTPDDGSLSFGPMDDCLNYLMPLGGFTFQAPPAG